MYTNTLITARSVYIIYNILQVCSDRIYREIFRFDEYKLTRQCTYHILFYKSNDEYNRILDRIREKEKTTIPGTKEVVKPDHTDIFRY